MCDFSLQAVASRPAKVGDKLITTNFGTGTCGFATIEDAATAVCVLPGSEIAFDAPIETGFLKLPPHNVAIFRQVNKDNPLAHHDTLELPGGEQILLTVLRVGQTATVLQLPAAPKTPEEAQDQRRVEFVG